MDVIRIRDANEELNSGQALVEFALLTPVLLLLVLAGIQLGAIIYQYVSVIQVAREGTRWAAVNAGQTDTAVTNQIKNNYVPATLTKNNLYISLSSAYSGGAVPSSRYTGMPLSIGISYSLQGKLFFPSNFMGVQVIPTMIPAYTVTMRVERL